MKLDSIIFWFTVLCVSVSLSVWQIMDLGTCCLHFLHGLKCSLNLSSEQRKVFWDFLNTKVFWPWNFGLLGKKSVHGWPKSPSWYTNSWPYITPPRVEPHCQLSSLLVHWSHWERNTHPMLHKCGGVHQI